MQMKFPAQTMTKHAVFNIFFVFRVVVTVLT